MNANLNKHQRREVQVMALEVRAIAAETRAYGRGRNAEDKAKLEELAAGMEATAAMLEEDAGGPLPAHKPATAREKKHARAAALRALTNTIDPDVYANQMQKMGEA